MSCCDNWWMFFSAILDLQHPWCDLWLIKFLPVLAWLFEIFLLSWRLHFAMHTVRGLSVKIPNNANKSFSHYLGATDLCPLPGTLLHFSYITPTFLPVLQAFLECLFWNTAKLCQRLFFNFLDTSIVVTSVWISAWWGETSPLVQDLRVRRLGNDSRLVSHCSPHCFVPKCFF